MCVHAPVFDLMTYQACLLVALFPGRVEGLGTRLVCTKVNEFNYYGMLVASFPGKHCFWLREEHHATERRGHGNKAVTEDEVIHRFRSSLECLC